MRLGLMIAGLVAIAGVLAAGGADAAVRKGADCAGPPVATAVTGSSAGKGAAAAPVRRPALAFVRQEMASRQSPSGVVLAGVAVPVSARPEDVTALASRLDGWAGSAVTVYGGRVRLDRHDRVSGQAVAIDSAGRATWVQAQLVADGLAVVADDAGPCTALLLGLEADARSNGRGVFAAPGAAIDATGPIPRGLPGFVILEGRVVTVGKTTGTTYLNFGTDRRTDATVRISRRNSADFPVEKELSRMAGVWIRVRGWAFDRDGMDLAVSDAGLIEIIEERREPAE